MDPPTGVAELYDPGMNQWKPAGSMLSPRYLHTATLLQSGKVLLTGGYHAGMLLSSAEVFDLGAPVGSPCAISAACESGFCVDGVCCGTACAGACLACSAAKKGSGANGTCGFIEIGTNPDNECVEQGPASCGTRAFCDGAGACQKYPIGTVLHRSDVFGINPRSGERVRREWHLRSRRDPELRSVRMRRRHVCIELCERRGVRGRSLLQQCGLCPQAGAGRAVPRIEHMLERQMRGRGMLQ